MSICLASFLKTPVYIFLMEEFEAIPIGPLHKPNKTQLLFKGSIEKDYLD